jgi:hypothetical protein
MGNWRMQVITIGDETPAPIDLTRFAALSECWISSSPVIDEVEFVGGSIHSMWLTSCGVQSINIRDNDHLDEIDAANNPIASIAISGCDGIRRINFSNCGLDGDTVDYVLAYMDALGVESGTEYPFTVDLGGTNAAPSATGIAHATALRGRNWTVTTN